MGMMLKAAMAMVPTSNPNHSYGLFIGWCNGERVSLRLDSLRALAEVFADIENWQDIEAINIVRTDISIDTEPRLDL